MPSGFPWEKKGSARSWLVDFKGIGTLLKKRRKKEATHWATGPPDVETKPTTGHQCLHEPWSVLHRISTPWALQKANHPYSPVGKPLQMEPNAFKTRRIKDQCTFQPRIGHVRASEPEPGDFHV